MRRNYIGNLQLTAAALLFALFIGSCKKNSITTVNTQKPLAQIGLYEVDSSVYKRIIVPITRVGNQTVQYYSVFDTGSSGMTLDATGVIPASMITASGINVPGDSVTVNGITITNKQATIAYGNAQSEIREYGNLAYANVTIGNNGSTIATPRIPIFLYYKIMDVTNNKPLPAHSNDVFGVGPGYSSANSAIGSPLGYFNPGAGITSGYKLAKLDNSAFSITGTYVSNLLTVGLVPDDLSSSSGFIMHPLQYYNQGGYSPDIAATVSYNGTSVAATILFDTGTPAFSIIANSHVSGVSTLPANTNVTLTTVNGFSYSYTTASANDVTKVANPNFTGDPRTIFSINFFTDNEFLMDYESHQIGLKNN